MVTTIDMDKKCDGRGRHTGMCSVLYLWWRHTMDTIVRSLVVIAVLFFIVSLMPLPEARQRVTPEAELVLHLQLSTPPELKAYILKSRAESYWNTYYPAIGDFIEKGEFESGLFVEIGTGWGGLPVYLLDRFPILHVVSVDPFVPGYDSGDSHAMDLGRLAVLYPDLQQLFASIFREEMARFGERYRLVHNFSTSAVFETASIDVLFIDGLHTTDGVRADINHLLPFVKYKHPIVFNDYPNFPSVVVAVDEFASRLGHPVVVLDKSNVVVWVD